MVDCETALSFSTILLAPHTVYVLSIYIQIFIFLSTKKTSQTCEAKLFIYIEILEMGFIILFRTYIISSSTREIVYPTFGWLLLTS